MDSTREKLSELEALAKPLADYLQRNHHPHTAIVVTSERVVLAEEMMGAPFSYRNLEY